jgi:hypothetical protein
MDIFSILQNLLAGRGREIVARVQRAMKISSFVSNGVEIAADVNHNPGTGEKCPLVKPAFLAASTNCATRSRRGG